MLKKLYMLTRHFTLPIIVFLFLIYCFLDKSLWSDFNGYLTSFKAPIRKGVLALMIFLAMSYILRKILAVGLPHIFRRLHLNQSTESSVTAVLGYVSVLIAFLIALSVMGVNLKSLGVLISALSIGLGFGLQHIVNNFISGILILFERPFRIGDWIVINGHEGIVRKINIRSTELETFDKAQIIIPNADIISGALTNCTLHDSMGRLVINVGVGYDSDLEKVLRLAVETTQNDDRILTDPPASAIVISFDDSSIGIQLRCYVGNISQRALVKSDLIIRIQKSFNQNGIEIPFPQRVVTMQAKE
ncbi:MAG: mechanosensitive ion channel [Alphaproteobacteria bacterium]|nr:mechanosensitive ion channel [Alphaproteobacteria bacterium]